MGRVMTAPASGNVHPIGRANGAPSLAPMMALVAQGMNQVNAVNPGPDAVAHPTDP
jgi:octaprenyl-diphosphate synthase